MLNRVGVCHEKPDHTKKAQLRNGRKRVLIEFPIGLLERTNNAAEQLEKNRSELIRSAIEQFLAQMESKKFEADLASAYAANSKMNLELIDELP